MYSTKRLFQTDSCLRQVRQAVKLSDLWQGHVQFPDVSEHRTADFISALKKDRGRLTFFSAPEAANDDGEPSAAVSPLDATTPMWADDADLFSDTAALHDLQTALAATLLPVMDNLERAVDAAKDSPDVQLKEGVGLVLRQLGDVFQKQGITPIDRLGEKLALVVESNQIEEGIMDLLRQLLQAF